MTEKQYVFATVHRSENTDNIERLRNILHAFHEISQVTPFVFAVHPRTSKLLVKEGLFSLIPHVQVIEPLNYIDNLSLQMNASVILTDSGGMQKEAMWLGVPCVTLREETEWVETVESQMNLLAGAAKESIIQSYQKMIGRKPPQDLPAQAPVKAGEQVVQILAHENTL